LNIFRFLYWLAARYVAQHPLLGVLNVLSIATGVTLFLAIQLANVSANKSFAETIDLIAGKAQLEITAPANDLPDDALRIAQQTPGVTAATPLVRGLVTLPEFPGEYLDVLGIDIFTNTPFRNFELTNFDAHDFDITEWLGDGDGLALTESFAQEHHFRRGDALRVQVNGVERKMRVGFILRGDLTRGGNDRFAAMDIGWAQELFAMRGKLNAIELRAAGERAAVSKRLRAQFPPTVEIAAPSRRSEQVDKMLASFQLNLTAMSLVSLLVGGFLIFNTISASVVRRRREIGILRALGTSRVQVSAIFIGEAAVAGLIGTALGLLFGTLLARGLLGAVSNTVSALYVLIDVREIALNLPAYIAAALLGLVSAIGAAVIPARAAGLMAPVRALQPDVYSETRATNGRWRLIAATSFMGLVAGLAAILFSAIALHFGPAWLSFLAAFFCLAGAACLAPLVVKAMASVAPQFLRPGKLEPEIAALNLRRSLSRNSITTAALACAVAMALAVSVMIFSFRETITTWINQTLVADLFISPATNEIAGPSSFMPPAAISFFESNDAVVAVDTFRMIELPFRGERMALAAIRAVGARTFVFTQGNQAQLMERFRNERCVIISESFARRYHLRAGEPLDIPTSKGPVRLPIAGIFYDYTRDQGTVYTSARNFVALFGDARVNSIAIYLRKDGEPLLTTFRQRFSREGEFAIYSNRALRNRAFEVFDQTFAITYLLRAIAVIVAILGIFLSFSTLVLERTHPLAILRALGTSARQIRSITIWESLYVGIVASILGMIAGIGLAIILTEVVNRAFFGWTIQLHFPWLILGTTPLWILASVVLAAILPAVRAGRLNLSEVLRAE